MTPRARLRGVSGVREAVLTLTALLGLACILAAAACLTLGLRPVVFRSGSMAPTIGTGALAVSEHVDAKDLRIGDIVTVRTATGSRVTHRIVDITTRPGSVTLQLRGDANDVNDPYPYTVAGAERVRFWIPGAGYVLAWLAGPVGMLVLGVYAGALLWLVLGRVRPGRHRAGTAGLAAVLVIGTTSAATVTRLSEPTQASFVNTVTVTGMSFGAAVIAPPATFTCGTLGVFSVTFNWSAVAGATNYTLHTGVGGATTTTVTATTATLITAISGGTAWVQTNRNFGSVTWTSAASQTRSYTVAAVSVCT